MDTPSFESEIDVERLLASPAHVVWVANLAARLIRDEADRQDAVQDSLLATWVRRASLRFPRAFAAVYLRSAGAHAARGRSRRGARERAAMRADPPSDPAHLVEQADLYGLLIRKLAALDEPYRSTLIQRYVDDLEPYEIARRAGVPAATIRSRLQRGLEKLRAELDAAHGGDRETWVRAFILLLPARVGATALVAAPLAAGLVVFAAFLLASEPAPPVMMEPPAAQVAANDSASAPGESGAARDGSAVERTTREALSDTLPFALLDRPDERVHHIVACDLGGHAIAGARVSLVASGKARDAALAGPSALTSTVADGEGRAKVTFDPDMIDVSDRAIRVERSGYEPRTFPIDESIAEQRLSVSDAGTMRMTCTVVDATGVPVSAATVSYGHDTCTNSAGEFELAVHAMTAHPRVRIRVPGALSESAVVGGPVDGSGPRIVALSPTCSLTIVTVDAQSGVPVADAAWSEVLGVDAFAASASTVVATADVAGTVTLRIPLPNEPMARDRSMIVRASGYAPALVQLPLEDIETAIVKLERAAAVRGVLVDATTHASIASARVLVQVFAIRTPGKPEEKQLLGDLAGHAVFPEQGVVLRTDSAGRFSRDELPARNELRVTVVGDSNYEPSTFIAVLGPPGSAAADIEVNARPAQETGTFGRVAGTMSFNGATGPIPFHWMCAGRSGAAHADAQGQYVIDRLPAGRLLLRTFVPLICEHNDDVEVRAGETTRFNVELHTPLSHVAGRMLHADGSVAVMTLMTFRWDTQSFEYSLIQASTDAQGRFEAWLPVAAKTALRIMPEVRGPKEPLPGVAGDEAMLLVLPDGDLGG